MTITQMEYIIAVEKFGSFVTAAESCNVTQPTLSMQIQKLEDELGIKLFDRNHHPVLATELGMPILMQAKNVLFEVNKIYEILNNKTEELKGNLNVRHITNFSTICFTKNVTRIYGKVSASRVANF